jgi:hypothetical protein
VTTVFQVDDGIAQGRLPRVVGFGAGAFNFELGHAQRIAEDLEIGSKIVLSQNVLWTFATEPFVYLQHLIVAPSVGTPGVRWRVTLSLVNDAATETIFYRRVLQPNGRTLVCNCHISTKSTTVPGTTGGTLRLTLELVAA